LIRGIFPVSEGKERGREGGREGRKPEELLIWEMHMGDAGVSQYDTLGEHDGKGGKECGKEYGRKARDEKS